MAKRKLKRRAEERIDKVSVLKRSAWKDFLLRFVRADDWSIPLALFVGSRLAIWLIPLLLRGLIPVQENQALVDIFMRWDAGWYAGIAKDGYHWAGPETQSSVAFFPLYPLLSRIVSFVLLGNIPLAMFVVSNFAFLIYLHYLYLLARDDFDPPTAERSALYVAAFFLSFFFSAGYTEALFLALTTSAFYYARKGRWSLAIPLGTLSCLTRLAGVALTFPLVWEWYKQKGLSPKALVLTLVPMGLGIFMVYLGHLTGDPFAFNTIQKAWSHRLTWPWGTFSIAWQLVKTLPLTRYVTAIAWIDFGTMVIFLVLILAMIPRTPPSYWLYSVPVYFISTSATLDPAAGLPTASIARYLMSIFPVFVFIGYLGKNRWVHYIVLFTSLVLLGPLLLYFLAGIWVE